MVYISAGHSPFSSRKDFGAEGCNYKEALLAIELRDLICKELDFFKVRYVKDLDTETLGQYLERIKTGNASVVCEIHWNAATGKASGTEVLIQEDGDRLDNAFAKELCDITANLLKIPNRGVKKESESARGRLGLMREQGLVCLPEICFIDNCEDMKKYQEVKVKLAHEFAKILIKYENLIS